MKRILCIDGGGQKGKITTAVLAEIEREITETRPFIRLCQIFDLIVGSSTGVVIGAHLATGGHASKTDELYKQIGPKLFGRSACRNTWARRPWDGRYKREKFLEEFEKWIPNVKMRELQTDLIATSVSLVDHRTHFFKSWEQVDGELQLHDVIARSALSAPLYFEPVDDPPGKQVWIDGGSGAHNCPMEHAVIESIRSSWTGEEVRIVSLGTGYANVTRPYEVARKRESWKSVSDYINLAREQAETDQMDRWRNGWSKTLPMVKIARVTVEIPAKINVIDGDKYVDDYDRIGKALGASVAGDVARFLEAGE